MTHEALTYTCILLNILAAAGIAYSKYDKSFDQKAYAFSGIVVVFNLLYAILDWTLS